MNKTLDYYNNNAQNFIQGTVDVDFRDMQDKYLALIPEGGTILDFGCGSGRDTKYFLEKGYNVTACDGSEELCKLASEYTGIEVKHKLFQELDDIERYDGIWACSSILHVPSVELTDVVLKMKMALKPGGIIYTSFKYGDFEGERNGRYFTNMTEDSMRELLDEVGGLEVIQQWITGDVRPGRDEEKWLNILLKK